MTIRWDPAYRLGMRMIDAHHKRIITLINKLNRAVEEGKEETISKKILENLTAYTQYHFSTEEGWFLASDYPDADMHIGQHEEFRRRLEEFKTLMQHGEKSLEMKQLSVFLFTWFTNHILTVDMHLAAYLGEKDKA